MAVADMPSNVLSHLSEAAARELIDRAKPLAEFAFQVLDWLDRAKEPEDSKRRIPKRPIPKIGYIRFDQYDHFFVMRYSFGFETDIEIRLVAKPEGWLVRSARKIEYGRYFPSRGEKLTDRQRYERTREISRIGCVDQIRFNLVDRERWNQPFPPDLSDEEREAPLHLDPVDHERW
jgi:hypothetical protein